MITKRGKSLVGALIIASAVIVAPAASADPPWPIERSMDNPGITTTPGGDVVLSECFPQSHVRNYWSQTFNAAGQQIASVANTGQSYVEGCHYGSFVGRDNRRFTLERTAPNQSLSNVVGYQGNQQIWSYTPSTSCSSGVYGIQARGIAGNGTTAYLVINNGCGSNPMLGGMELIGISMVTGAVQYQVAVGSYNIRPYLNGYVYYAYGQGFTYLNGSGVVEAGKGYSTSDSVTGWSLGANGELAVLYSSAPNGCTQYLMLRNSRGTAYRNLVPGSGCQYQTVHVTPTGSAVVAGYGNFMYMQDFSIIDETPTPPVKKVSAVTTTTASVQVDVAGNVLVTDAAGVTVYNAQGANLQRLEFDDYFPALSSVPFEARAAFSQGTMYAVAQQYPHGQYDPAGYPTYLAKVSVPGIGIDYPRGTFLGDTTVPTEPFVDYIAMGDSFSSGEGVPPFESGTDNPGVNECHRSPKAYARVLAQEKGFNLTHFAACSGAKAARLTSTWEGLGKNLDEPAQWDHLSVDIDLVTMMLGGNDMPFEVFANACINPLFPPCGGQAKTDAMAGIVNNVIPQVRSALTALSGKLNTLGSDASVLVIGYPYLVPKTVYPNIPIDCNWLDPGEHAAIREVTDALNTAIKNEVEAIYNNFYFVSATESTSPFIGRELCREEADPNPGYFNDYEGPNAPREYIAHPNEAGQQAYADLVSDWLALHPEVFTM